MNLRPLSFVVVTVVLLACGACTTSTSDSHEERLLARGRTDDWVEADAATPEGRRTIADELARARGAVVAAGPPP